MPLELIDTPGADDANTYCSVEDADAYHATRTFSDTWTDADGGDKKKALVQATRLLDQWFEWDGVVTTSAQALLWPRSAVIGPNGYLEDSEAIPVRIREAAAELARQLIAADRTADSDTETQGIKKVVAGSVQVEFSGSGGAKPIPDAVMGFVSCYGRKRSASGGAVTLLRG